jgi:hypothetical protein
MIEAQSNGETEHITSEAPTKKEKKHIAPRAPTEERRQELKRKSFKNADINRDKALNLREFMRADFSFCER